jgi:hypothetical protein
MDPSALESVSRTLESSLDCWGLLIWVSTGAVALGLVIEYWEPISEFIEEWRRPAATFPWRKFWGLTGGILVTVGVVGEFAFTYKASRVETKLRANNHQIEILLGQGTSGALQKAAEANDRAAANDLAAQQLKAENLRLEAIIAPRSLSLDAQKRIADACKEFHGHNVLLTTYGLDGEAAALGGQVISLLQSVGINVLDNRGRNLSTGEFDVGVHVRNHFGANTESDFVTALGKSLHDVGKLQVAVNDPWPKSGGGMFGGGPAYTPGTVYVDVTVGVKPLPMLALAN